ncbi:F-box/kelch-repeat protein At3g06240-like [Arachis ipaensis]|uniref:F-box/kelch-repeat protein At3g06240-like n=1 Tax=Arachis ipaensis TaxID=130454 RepID=UPI0007AF5E6A|nr:F-box/kelch-repeat protein At3g06240-like [Arachis ipaensis]XP_025653427.1 F-box/kelch-repeat protein At3g06240-like [Arachis hypogaea]
MANHNDQIPNDQIPNDLALEILAKLPVKSLKRFSCVRKSWLNLLENPDFKSMYYENLKSKTAHSSSLLLWRLFYQRDENNVHLLSGERYENMVTLVLPTLVESYGPGEVLECVNGIICHYERGREVIGLWNPKTDEHKIIPPGISDDEPGFDRHVSVHGFGYDNVNDDYKVVQCVYYIYGRTLFEEPVLRIWQIYSLKSNCWKKLDLEMTQKEDVDKASIAYLNGVCHWWGSEFATDELEEQVLVSFNLSTETFRTTSIVWVQENDDSPTRTLVVLNESVTLISSFAQNNRIEISILGEVGVKESWVKLFTLGPFQSEFRYPMRMGNKCDVIFYIGNDSNELASFDVITGKVIHNINIKTRMFGYAHSYHPLEALDLFRRLVRTDFRPDGLIAATVC